MNLFLSPKIYNNKKVKATFFLIPLFLLSIISLHSQTIKIGPKIGINLSSLGLDQLDSLPSSDMLLGYEVGAFGRIYLGKVYLEPDILYSTNRASIDVLDINKSELIKSHVSFQNLRNSLVMGIRIGTLRIYSGPSIVMPLSDQGISLKNSIIDLNSKDRPLYWTLKAGLGFNIARKWNFDLSYFRSLSQFSYQVTPSNSSPKDYSGYANFFSVTLGYNLIRF